MPRNIRLPKNANQFKRRLLAWFRREGRDLPWRKTRDPYRVLVSEFMLQQTQVARVTDYYARFVAQFPTLQSLARAQPDRVREAWDGLGYYRRASNLHRLARTVVTDHEGRIPGDPTLLEQLPGVGRYTAGAVASFAYRHRTAAVDTNVRRVLRRVFRPPRNRQRSDTDIWNLAERLLPRRRETVWEFNQALMDLGSTFCVARRPRCASCPMRPACHTGHRISDDHDRRT